MDGLLSMASSDPLVGFSVAVRLAQVVPGSVGSLTAPHCVATLAVVAGDVEVLDDEVVDDVEVDDEVVVVVDDVDSVEEADAPDEVSVEDVEAATGVAVDEEPEADDEVSPALADDDDPPPHATTQALSTAIARRRASRRRCPAASLHELSWVADALPPQIVCGRTKDGRRSEAVRCLLGVDDISWCVG